ncbi:hypothetical protein DWB85_15950 [Seongchinamella sediminis]|uniref:Uncharacterized protein n=1 Tax=Seongchinamella sediminis TaxID=2283635 RepID=A0A3L7DVD2_9GAMM|nr:hypothetical protein DWB85_15950 [Seongchinamella sediminis]
MSDEFKARRRLLKASAAAPLIATLTPNASAALGSVAQCALNGIDDGSLQGTAEITTTEDFLSNNRTAVRCEGIIYTKNDKTPIYRVPADSVDYYYSDTGYSVPDNKIPNKNSDNVGWAEQPAWFLQRFNIAADGSFTPPEGKVFFLAPDGHAIAGTCWTSIMAAP